MCKMSEYSIRDLSEMFKLPSSTLRYYEEAGILTNIARSTSGQRIYNDNHINRLRTICCFKNTGMTIAQIRDFFSYESEESDHIDDILLLLHTHRKSVIEQIERLQNDYAHINRKVHYYSDIKKNIEEGEPIPEWKYYRDKLYDE